ncbi:YtpI family protein [Bacillus songklensis]|uniref:YtpI family protein n=1 Tax=Bacillus songklensis TaxID=1069116 RepID=A0ABV8AZ28_9BACI
MPIFVILIIISLSFYLYFKTKYFRTKRPMEKQWISAKSSIALGAFVLLFGINQYFIHQSTLSIVIGILFIAMGGGSIWAGMRAYKYYYPLAVKETHE